MRINVPFGSGAQPVTIIIPNQSGKFVIQNVSAVNIWVSDNVSALTASIDSTGTPQQGFLLAPNAPFSGELPIPSSGLYALSAAAGAILEIMVVLC